MKNWLRSLFKKPQPLADLPLFGNENTVPANDINKVVRFGVLALVLGFGGFVLWAALAPIDEGVPAAGVVIVDSKRKAVQHLQGGIIDKILVRDGDLVKAGQPLIRLDQTQLEGNLSTVRNNFWQMQATFDRLQAEQRRANQIQFSPKLVAASASAPKAKDVLEFQQQLFDSRRTALANQRNILAQTAAGAEEQVRGLRSLEQSRAKQIALIEKDLGGLRDLVQEGFAPRSRLVEVERMLAQLNGERATTLADIERVTRSVSEMKLRGIQVEQEFLKEVDTQLSQVQGDLNRWTNELRVREEEMERSVLRAPTEGHVVSLAVHTEGGVVRPGEVLMEIVPEDDQLVVELHIQPHLIDKVHVGLNAEVRFSSLGTRGQVPVLQGELKTISADSTTDQRGNSYYLAKVHVTGDSMAALTKQNLKIQPGMPAEVVIKTGERSLLDYLIRPLMNHITPALKEH